MILTQQRTVKMKKKIIKTCASNGRQPLKRRLNRERCSWKMWAVKKNQKKRMRHHSRRKIPAVMKIF
ncbi:nuclear casein kinase and cyclin dependent kinase substrate 1 [Phyllostomus discolor]|uniref:Nuclear casein kinase and cyclin dependent kinase substrate 1 n=1 Tax=Phyllostomus discolor TaxID=89673 RepID=A0A833YCM4_9CHIR|nr:nuclear casein kinase and cyclin dependent kinase substrate 1 [Phyllostomus discolor]